MPIYSVNCPHCMATTVHSTKTSDEATTQHSSGKRHAEVQSLMDEVFNRSSSFKHGKDHNA